jgi:hypothetical protein
MQPGATPVDRAGESLRIRPCPPADARPGFENKNALPCFLKSARRCQSGSAGTDDQSIDR